MDNTIIGITESGITISELGEDLLAFSDENDNHWQVEITDEVEHDYGFYMQTAVMPVSLPEWAAEKFRPKVVTPPPLPRGDKQTFVDALEEAFWSVDGPAKLRKLAETNPLEFLKICAKLIPVDAADKTPRGGLSVTFNVQKPGDEGGKVIEHQSEDF